MSTRQSLNYVCACWLWCASRWIRVVIIKTKAWATKTHTADKWFCITCDGPIWLQLVYLKRFPGCDTSSWGFTGWVVFAAFQRPSSEGGSVVQTAVGNSMNSSLGKTRRAKVGWKSSRSRLRRRATKALHLHLARLEEGTSTLGFVRGRNNCDSLSLIHW